MPWLKREQYLARQKRQQVLHREQRFGYVENRTLVDRVQLFG